MTDVLRSLHIEGEAAKALVLNIKDVVGDDEEMIETAVEGETGLKEVISRAVDRIAEINGHREALETRIKGLTERRDRFENQAERIKAAIHQAMGHASLKKLELEQATLSVRSVPPKVEITNEAEIPSRFWKPQDPKLDKKAIADALKSNVPVPGATMGNGGECLSIRSA